MHGALPSRDGPPRAFITIHYYTGRERALEAAGLT
jgi:hypothetical protein